MQTIVNGAGTVINLGTDDRSKRVRDVTPESAPQHLPMCFIFAQRGNGKFLVNGVSAIEIFGEKTFDPRSEYFNHVTLFAQEAIKNGNDVMIKRLIPTDAGPMANAILWLDILETTVDRYRRNPDGSIYLDEFGDPEITGTTPGLKAKWVCTNRTTVIEQLTMGDKVQVVGDQTDTDTDVDSVRFPIFEVQSSYYGADGKNVGFRLWAPTQEGGNSLPTQMMAKFQVYPYMFSVVSREDENTTAKYEKTLNGETQVMFTFAPDVVNPLTDQMLSWDQILIQSWNFIDVPGYPNIYGRIGKFYVYNDNIDAVLSLMYEYESEFINSNSDITEDETSKGLLNFVTGVSSQNVPYESFIFVDSVSSVRMSQYSNVFLKGGSDGTMSNEMFEELVSVEMDRYADPSDPVQDLAYNTESFLYDSGFSLDLKFKLAEFVSLRKNTTVILGTHTVGGDIMTQSEEHSIAVSLRTRLQLYPESEYFGTPVMRAMIMGCSGTVRDSEYTERVPATLEIMSKFSKYMGASNGAWKSGASPEGAPGNLVTRLKDINISWIPDSVRNQNWDVGLNWILRYDRSRLFIPAYKTVYNDDTSVLNSILTAAAIGQLNTIANACWRTLTGRSDLSPAQLCDRTNSYIRDAVSGRFDNRFTIIPAATITDQDDLRGFTWSLPIKIGAENQRTTMTTWVEAYRKADLNTNSGG
ncbi:MAG TPA: hypothetical protein VN843_14140 [Anaerolineales bacterium]|nr:hypothetical protein [Anaerolineales bacterium]